MLPEVWDALSLNVNFKTRKLLEKEGNSAVTIRVDELTTLFLPILKYFPELVPITSQTVFVAVATVQPVGVTPTPIPTPV